MEVCRHCGHGVDAGRVGLEERASIASENGRHTRIWPLRAWAEAVLRRAERWDELRVLLPSMCILVCIVATLPFCAWTKLVQSMCFLTLAVVAGLYFGAALNALLRTMILRARR